MWMGFFLAKKRGNRYKVSRANFALLSAIWICTFSASNAAVSLYGRTWYVVSLMVSSLNDTFAYIIDKSLGKHRLTTVCL